AVYEKSGLSVLVNGGLMARATRSRATMRWAKRPGPPTVFEIVRHNLEPTFPVNSPRLAYEIVREYKKVENCKGFLAWFLRSDPNDLFRKALGHYGRVGGPYSDAPWVALLEKRFGDRQWAAHFLLAYHATAR